LLLLSAIEESSLSTAKANRELFVAAVVASLLLSFDVLSL